tara:strand:+ start:20447 stop:21466 length:1020 start_codon:yes stop_codon:yes gene_type:complete
MFGDSKMMLKSGLGAASTIVALSLIASPLHAQTTKLTGVNRTPEGLPDISGVFTFRTLTPLQRPEALEGQDRLTAEEAAAFEASERTRLNRDLFDPESGAPSAGYQSRAEGGVLSYNEFWYERGIELTSDKRTSLVVDPPDGRIPYTTEFAEENRLRRLNLRNGFADHYTDRSLGDRCLMGSNSGPPMRPGSYNNNVMVLQTPGYVAIVNEHIHNTRIIPIESGPHGNIRQWVGDSRGRYENDALIVETRNFRQATNFTGSSAETTLIERFTRLDPDTVMYDFTIEDPNNYTRPWTVAIPFRRTDGPIYEYACHEGNYGLTGILAGARRLNTQPVEGSR